MSSSVRRVPGRMTVDEFRDWAATDAHKWQLVDGEPRAMAPARMVHGVIQNTLGYLLRRHLREQARGCVAVTEAAVIPHVRSRTNIRIPDLAVTCSPAGPDQFEVPEPVLLVEILSPSNEADTWENVWAYTTIPSAREILVLHATAIAAELLRRGADGNWPEDPTMFGPADTISLECIGFQCSVAEIYEDTHLALG